MLKLYRITTEATGGMADRAVDIMARAFPGGFTILRARGVWNGAHEDSIVLERIGHAEERTTVLMVASRIRDINEQQCVCVQIVDAELVPVTA